MSERLESTPPVGKSPRAEAPSHVALPEGRKAHDAPSVTALPKSVTAAATLEEMIGGTRVRSGGDCGGGDGGGGEGEGGGGEGEGGGGEGEGGGGDGGGGGGAGQVETRP